MWIETIEWNKEYDEQNKENYHPEINKNIDFFKYIINWLL